MQRISLQYGLCLFEVSDIHQNKSFNTLYCIKKSYNKYVLAYGDHPGAQNG